MRKEAVRGKLANRESAIECAREPHATRKRRPARGQPANHATLHQNRDRPANCKARPPNCGRPASPSQLPTSMPSRKSALRKRSENHPISWRIARPNVVVVVSAMYENVQTLPLPSMYDKNLAFKTGGVDATEFEEPLPSSSKDPSTRSALFRNDTRSTIFSRRTARLRRAKTAASKSSSRSGKNANAPQPKRRQEGHDKGLDYPHERRTLQPIGDKSEKTRLPMLWPNKFLASRRTTRVSKPWGLLNARSV